MGLPDPAVALNARVDQSRVWVTTFLGDVIISADNRNNTIRILNSVSYTHLTLPTKA